MQAILIYLAKTIIYSGIFFLYYHIALRNKRFHYYNRFYLLMSVALSLLLPFLNIELWQVQSSNEQVIQLMNVVSVDGIAKETNSSYFTLSRNGAGILLYASIVISMLITFIIHLYKLLHFRRKYPVEQLGNVFFINTDLQQAPFSFFNNLFWKNTIDIGDETGKQIFKHELTHIHEKHSWDKLFLQLTTCIFWINPFYWLMQKELGLIHEFIADERAIEDKNAEAFALMLLQSQYGKNIFSPAQSFNYSPIKRRLLMLTTSAKTSYSYTRRILVLPLLAGTILLFAFRLKEKEQSIALVHTNAPFTLLVDAGHGGSLDGAIGINGVKEKDINLSIAKKVQALAPEYGITVKMTRTADVVVDLKDRMNIIKAIRPDAFVSIHVSTTEEQQTSKNEVNVYITRAETNSNYQQSRLLGSSLLQAAKQDFPVNTTLRQRKDEGIYVIDQNPFPAVLVECGYMNNIENIKQLQDAGKVEQIARDILKGVAAYATAAPQATVTIAEDTTGKTPLYIIDGKEKTAAEVKKTDGAAIESINVLKGEEAIKIYGDKGKNGVVIVKLKNGDVKTEASTSDSTNIDLKSKTVNFPAKNLTIQADKISMKTANNEQPLYIVDGKELQKSEFNKLSPDDIESISVFKDEETIKKYGDKGRFGVISIKTRSNSQKQTPYFTPPVIVEDKNDSTVEFTGNTGLRATTTFINGDDKMLLDKGQINQSLTASSFPGGKEGLLQYLQRNLKSDITTQRGAPAGTYTVIVSFKVAADGTVSDVKADNDPGYGSGAEGVRVIKEGPKWIPAQQNGHSIATKAKQAITFRVDG